MQTNNAGEVGQAAALENLVPELARLEQSLADARASTLRALRDFATDSPDLQRLEEMLAEAKAQPPQFDLLQVIRPSFWEYEDVHSNIVAWLLDPRQSHGIGQNVLKDFLFRTCRTASELGMSAITPARIHSIDWSNTEVRREWRYIDILILNREARFVCAIENKIFASEGIGDDGISQLTWYRQTLAEEFPDFTKHLVFLDFKSGDPSENEQPYWIPENYLTILEMVEHSIDAQATALSEDVRVFLRQYATTLRKRGKVVPDNSKLQQLARQIYLEYRETIELLKEHEPDWNAETAQIFKEAIAKQRGWMLDLSNNSYVRFRSLDWDQFESLQSGTGWAPGSNALLLFQFRFDGDDIPYLDLGISPRDEDGSNDAIRARLFEAVRQNPQWFRLIHSSLPAGWGILHQEPDCILDDSDYGVAWDDGTTRAKIEAWVEKFANEQFPAMNKVIIKCLREYEAEAEG